MVIVMKSEPRRCSLTVRYLDSLRKKKLPPYQPVNYWDTNLPRFGVRVIGRANQNLNRVSFQVLARVPKPGGGTVPKRRSFGQYNPAAERPHLRRSRLRPRDLRATAREERSGRAR